MCLRRPNTTAASTPLSALVSPKEKTNLYVKTVSLPSTVRYIGTNAFAGFHALTTINFPDQLETIGASAFELSMKLTEVRLPGTVKVIGSHAFSDCQNIKSIELPGVEGNENSSPF